MPIRRADGFSKADHLPQSVISPLVGNAVVSGVRSFSRLFQAGTAQLSKIGFKASKNPTSEESSPTISPLQDGKAALQRLEFCKGGDIRCVLCASTHPDKSRLAKVAGLLAVERKVIVPILSRITGEPFSVVMQDLRFLAFELKLPIKHKSDGTVLLKSFSVCDQCAQIGAQLRETYSFKQHFKAASPGNTGLTSFGVQSGRGLGARPAELPNSC